jgi:hypothetical protein
MLYIKGLNFQWSVIGCMLIVLLFLDTNIYEVTLINCLKSECK